MKALKINCDVGEGLNIEEDLMPYIQMCNIACGGHAGDETSMKKVVDLAIKHQVKIGAHPSYPDRENFGRKSFKIPFIELKQAILDQINVLNTVVTNSNSILYHIKPHGALYNDLAKDKTLALSFLDIVAPFKKTCKLLVPYNSEIEKCALQQGFLILYEAFADRNYNNDLSLVARTHKNAVITDINQIKKQVAAIINNEKLTTITGEKVAIKADTFCVHSDTKNAVEIVENLHKHFHK